MAIGNRDTYGFSNYIKVPEVATTGSPIVINGSQVTVGVTYLKNQMNGEQVGVGTVYSKSNMTGAEAFVASPVVNKADKGELVRFGHRNPMSRLGGFLPPQIEPYDRTAARFNPVELGLGVELWLDSSDKSTVILDGSDRVSEWRDKSGKNKHHSQSTSGRRPYYDVVQNKLMGIRFVTADSTSLDYDSTNNDLPFLNPPYTIVAVNRQRGVNGFVYGIYTLTGNDYDALYKSNSTYIFDNNSGFARILGPAYTLNSMGVFSFRTPSLFTRNIRQNADQVDQTVTSTLNALNIQTKSSIGAFWRSANPTGATFMEGDMFELMVFNNYLEDNMIEYIENKMSQKWGITF